MPGLANSPAPVEQSDRVMRAEPFGAFHESELELTGNARSDRA